MPAPDSHALAIRFFDEHPRCRDEVKKATHAYHASHAEPGAHYFSGAQRLALCRWCDRSREQVRWDDLPPECAARPGYADTPIENVILREEELFEKVIARARRLADEVSPESLSGETLAVMHHTHGVDPSMLEVALLEAGKAGVPQAAHDGYLIAMETERRRSKAAQKKAIVCVREARPE